MRCTISNTITLLFCLAVGSNAFAPTPQSSSRTTSLNAVGRREAFSLLGGAAFMAAMNVPQVNALDMDAFANAQLAADAEKKVEKLNPDEALCKYGQGGTTARTEACKRVKAAGGQLPGKSAPVKSLGGAYAM
mmetsp:Transcript_8247/g.12135  ORF Transcript_8247/g.12135 Transcript_8247/m.12135 type:complete len:133 (-) Transcript_8247:297-695(-)